MSVLIKGLKMPRGCSECYIEERDTCRLLKVNVSGWGRMLNCPLVELPDHGDLIDRDSLKADLGITDWECDKCQWGGLFGCKRDDFSDACFFLENAEAIIPAERSEDGGEEH